MFHHQYVLGATGTGKSTLIAREVIQAFEQGLCSMVIDPHGDLSYDIIQGVSKDLDDVYLFDPLRVGFSLNPLELPFYRSEDERSILVERMIGETIEFLIKLYGRQYWGPSLNRIFQEGLRSLYKKDDSPTFKDLLDLVNQRLKGHHDFYADLKKLPKGRTDAVVNKLVPFVKNKVLRKIFCQKTSTLRIEEIIKEGRLIIWRLPKGELSEINSILLGSTVITKTWFNSMSRRTPVFLAIDEFQNFSHLETLRNMIAEGRKYRIALLLSHQHTQQIPQTLLSDILGNTGTKIVFRVSGSDANLIARLMGEDARLMQTLVNLPNGRAVVKLKAKFGERPTQPFEIYTLPLYKKNLLIPEVLERMKRFSAPDIEEEREVDVEMLKLLKAVHNILDRGEEACVSTLSKELSKPGTHVSNTLDRAETLGLVERRIVKGKGRPKILVYPTKKGERLIGIGSSGSSAKAGGELHRALLMKAKRLLERQGYFIEIIEQTRGEQPDALAIGDKRIAVEVETDAGHPSQVRKNYLKNIEKGREVYFFVPTENVKKRVERILGEIKAAKYKVFVLNEEYERRSSTQIAHKKGFLA